jgi:hypothetical protein
MPGKEATIEYAEKQVGPTGSDVQDNPGFPGCLDGWKDIASYLGRDVRTVQRWEKSLGLPVQRVQDSKSGSVHAFRSEIDAWRRERGRKISHERSSVVPLPAKTSEHTTAEGARSVHPWVLIALLSGLLLGVAGSQFISYVLHSAALAHSSDGSVYAHDAATNANRTALAPQTAHVRID